MSISVSILLPVIDETTSVDRTIETVEASSAEFVGEYIILVCKKTHEDSLNVCRRWVERNPQRFKLLFQTLPFLGGATRDGFTAATGTHVLVMSSDLETDPKSVREMIDAASANPESIIAGSRWKAGGSFSNYNPTKLVANKIFQTFFRTLYWTSATDLTFGFRILPIDLVKTIRWEGIRHELMMETLVKPLRLGRPVIEIATPWVARIEGVSHNSLFEHWRFFRIGLKTRFMSRASILGE